MASAARLGPAQGGGFVVAVTPRQAPLRRGRPQQRRRHRPARVRGDDGAARPRKGQAVLVSSGSRLPTSPHISPHLRRCAPSSPRRTSTDPARSTSTSSCACRCATFTAAATRPDGRATIAIRTAIRRSSSSSSSSSRGSSSRGSSTPPRRCRAAEEEGAEREGEGARRRTPPPRGLTATAHTATVTTAAATRRKTAPAAAAAAAEEEEEEEEQEQEEVQVGLGCASHRPSSQGPAAARLGGRRRPAAGAAAPPAEARSRVRTVAPQLVENGPPAMPDDPTSSASLGHLQAQAAPAHPGAPPGPLGGSTVASGARLRPAPRLRILRFPRLGTADAHPRRGELQGL